MTVYVDDMKVAFAPKHRPGRKYVLCHMVADTEDELHAMAARIGIARRWYQGDHYDIAQSKRAGAIAAGARAVTWRQLGCMMALRRMGEPMPAPEAAEDALCAWRKSDRLVTARSHPMLFEAFETISHDGGGRCGHQSYTVPTRLVGQLAAAETVLATLSAPDLETFCIGEEQEAAAIAGRSSALQAAHELLNIFFYESWPREGRQ